MELFADEMDALFQEAVHIDDNETPDICAFFADVYLWLIPAVVALICIILVVICCLNRFVRIDAVFARPRVTLLSSLLCDVPQGRGTSVV